MRIGDRLKYGKVRLGNTQERSSDGVQAVAKAGKMYIRIKGLSLL